jgi:hypothetical protein
MAWLWLFAFAMPGAAMAEGLPIATFAGVAYSGDAQSQQQRFPYSKLYEARLKAAGQSAYARALAHVQQVPAQHLQISTDPIDELKGRDQALVVSLVLNSETVSVETFGGVRKLFILIRGQALFFDFKSMMAVRSYPLSYAYIDNLRHDPSQEEIMERVAKVYEGAGGKPGIFGRFAQVLATATVPSQTPRFLQVTDIQIPAAMAEMLPGYLKDATVHKTWAADIVGEAISSRVGVPIIPFAMGHAVGNVMRMQVLDGDVYTPQLPSADYAISVDFKGFKKVKFKESSGGTSYVYGTFADLNIQEPGGPVFLRTSLKNAEVKVVPATQTHVDDFPAFYDSLNGLFVKLAEAVAAGKGNDWLKSAAAESDIDAQIVKTRDLMNLCK